MKPKLSLLENAKLTSEYVKDSMLNMACWRMLNELLNIVEDGLLESAK